MGRAVASEFELQERDAGGPSPRRQVTRTLRDAWPLPRDTYITDGIPELLTRLALVPDSPGGEIAADDGAEPDPS